MSVVTIRLLHRSLSKNFFIAFLSATEGTENTEKHDSRFTIHYLWAGAKKARNKVCVTQSAG